MDINYKPKVEGWLENKKSYKLQLFGKILMLISLLAFITFTISLYAEFNNLTNATVVILFSSFPIGWYLYLKHLLILKYNNKNF